MAPDGFMAEYRTRNEGDDALVGQEPRGRSGEAAARAAWDNPWLILGLLFFVTLFLGLPLVWFSRSFRRSAKWLITVVVLLYSVLFSWLFYMVMAWCYARISDALK